MVVWVRYWNLKTSFPFHHLLTQALRLKPFQRKTEGASPVLPSTFVVGQNVEGGQTARVYYFIIFHFSTNGHWLSVCCQRSWCKHKGEGSNYHLAALPRIKMFSRFFFIIIQARNASKFDLPRLRRGSGWGCNSFSCAKHNVRIKVKNATVTIAFYWLSMNWIHDYYGVYKYGVLLAQLHKSVALQSYYPKNIVVLCIKNVRFCTPRSCALNPFNFEFRDSAWAFVDLLIKKLRKIRKIVLAFVRLFRNL